VPEEVPAGPVQRSAHGPQAASPWVQRFGMHAAAGEHVLDVACGSGRHVRWFAQRGCRVTAVDRDAQALEALRPLAEVLVADLENGPWPLPGRCFHAVVVTNYLWRPLWPALLDSVAPGGWLIHETFAAGHQTVGRPSNPQFLLQPGELLDAVRGRLRVVAYEDGFLGDPDRFVQRIAAVAEAPGPAAPPRYPL
jgi:SAM-dependent methyltransferase